MRDRHASDERPEGREQDHLVSGIEERRAGDAEPGGRAGDDLDALALEGADRSKHGLARLSRRYRTPVNALFLQTIISVVIGLGAAALIGPAKVFNVVGLMFTFALIPVFVLGALACFLLYLREYRSEFNWLLHVVSPVITVVALLTVGYYSLNPAPVYPFNWALPICGAWLVIGLVILLVLKIRGNESWMRGAGEAVLDRPIEPPASAEGSG